MLHFWGERASQLVMYQILKEMMEKDCEPIDSRSHFWKMQSDIFLIYDCGQVPFSKRSVLTILQQMNAPYNVRLQMR